MTREEKNQIIDTLVEKIKGSNVFYLTDISSLNAESTGNLRRKCFEKEIKLMVVKNTMLKKALEKIGDSKYDELNSVLKGGTSLMFSEAAKAPAQLIQEFRKKMDQPVLKAAYIEECLYIGDDNLKALTVLKSKEELIGDIVFLIKSPAVRVISSLKSAGSTLSGLLETLSKKEEKGN